MKKILSFAAIFLILLSTPLTLTPRIKAQSEIMISTTPLPNPSSAHHCAVHDNRIYVVGGETPTSGIRYDRVLIGSVLPNGHIEDPPSWQENPTHLPEERTNAPVVVYEDWIYVLDGSANSPGWIERDTVWFASFNPDGSIGSWTVTTSLPYRGCEEAVQWNGRIYIMGGWDGYSEHDDVYYAEIDQSSGHLGAWVKTSSLPRELAHGHATVVYNGVIYVLGGHEAYPQPEQYVNEVHYAAIDEVSGEVGGWISTTPLPVPLDTHDVVVYNNEIFAIGGGVPAAPTSDVVYKATINSDGSLGNWEVYGHLPEPLGSVGSVVLNDRIYVIGGHLQDGTIVDTVHFTPVAPRQYTLVFVPLNWQGDLGSFHTEVTSQSDFIIDSTILTPENTEISVVDENLVLDFDKSNYNNFDEWSAIEEFALNHGVSGARYIAITNEDIWGNVVGLSNWGHVVVYDVSTPYLEVSAHELGHSWHLLDEYNLDTWQREADYFESVGWTIPNTYPGYDGGRLFNGYRCIMGYAGMSEPRAFCEECSPWLDNYIWQEWVEPSLALAAVVMTFYRDGSTPQVESLTGYNLPGKLMQSSLPSNYSLQTYSELGNLLYSSNITYSFQIIPSQPQDGNSLPVLLDTTTVLWLVPVYTLGETVTVSLKDNVANEVISIHTVTVEALWSSDFLGNSKDIFLPGETVYVTVPATGQTVTLYVVADQTTWNNGDSLTDVSDGLETLTLNPGPGTQTIQIWAPPLVAGNYDIVMDADNDGVFDAGQDLVDSLQIAGFNVVPEVPLGAAMALLSMIFALVGYLGFKRFRPKFPL